MLQIRTLHWCFSSDGSYRLILIFHSRTLSPGGDEWNAKRMLKRAVNSWCYDNNAPKRRNNLNKTMMLRWRIQIQNSFEVKIVITSHSRLPYGDNSTWAIKLFAAIKLHQTIWWLSRLSFIRFAFSSMLLINSNRFEFPTYLGEIGYSLWLIFSSLVIKHKINRNTCLKINVCLS